jgi:hypothetical protein
MNTIELNRQNFTLSLHQAMSQYLVAAFNTLKDLESKINNLEDQIAISPRHIPVAEPVAVKPTPTPAVANMVHRMSITTYNDTPEYWMKMKIKGDHREIVLWKGGIVTTTGGDADDRNPLAQFGSRNKAIARLRKAGWNVPQCKDANGHPQCPKFIIATC